MPMYIHTIRLLKPRNNREGEKFNLLYTNPAEITNVSDKLKYYRYQKSLYQSDVANYVGMDRGTYSGYEENARDYYPPEMMDKISALFEIDVYELLDDYNRFLYDGQGQQIKAIRKQLQITQKDLAIMMNVDLYKVKRWEQNKVRMFKYTWKKLFEQFNQMVSANL